MKIVFFLLLVHTLFGATVCENQLFSLSAYKQKYTNAINIATIVKELSNTCELSVVFNDDISKKKLQKKLDYVNINDYTFEQFLDFLFNEADLFYTYDPEKNIISVQYLQTKTFNIDYIYLSESSSQNSKTITTGSTGGGGGTTTSSNDQTTIRSSSRFTFWDTLQNNILKLFPAKSNIKLFVNKNASLLTVTATKKNLKKIDTYIKVLLSTMHKQVTIEAKIIELTYDDSSSTGIDWSQLSISLSGSMNGQTSAYSLSYSFATEKILKFLKNYGNIQVLSNPRIVTMNNQPAVINVGEQISYQNSSVAISGGAAGTTAVSNSSSSTFVGITLYVIPQVSKDNEIIMKINPVVSKLSDDTIAPGETRQLPPDTKIKQLTSIVRIKNDQKIVIGGLVSVTKGRTSTKVPLLGDIPLIGSVFNYKEKIKKKTEMFIIIQPHVITQKSIPALRDIEFEDPFFKSTFKKTEISIQQGL